MSTNKKILIGVLSFLPLVLFIAYFVFIFGFMFSTMDNANTSGPADPSEFMGSFIGMFASMGLMLISTFGLLIYFIMHAAQNPKFDDTERLVWILIIVFLGFIAYPIYWYVKIWSDKDQEQ